VGGRGAERGGVRWGAGASRARPVARRPGDLGSLVPAMRD
jgi:hypothetical protein